MMSGHVLMKLLLGAALGVLLAVHDVWPDDPVFWIATLSMIVAGMIGYDEGRHETR